MLACVVRYLNRILGVLHASPVTYYYGACYLNSPTRHTNASVLNYACFASLPKTNKIAGL